MEKETIRSTITAFFEERGSAPKLDDDLFDSGFLDSMSMIDLIVLLENTGVKFHNSDFTVENFSSIGDILKLALQRTSS